MTASVVAEEDDGATEQKEQIADKDADVKVEQPGDDAGPPESAVKQDDGSYVETLEDGSSLRWTQRPDGSWRRPERVRANSGAASRIAAELSSAKSDSPTKAEPAPAAPEPPTTNGNGTAAFPAEPPPEAVVQPDGSHIFEMPDRSTLRWTKRPDGTWRRPEHKREGWVGELEQEKYAPPPIRDGTGVGVLEAAEVATANESEETSTNGIAEPKHPLEHRWCFWVNRRAKLLGNLPWSQRGMLGYEFETAEDFFGMVNHSYPVSKLEDNDCSLFKKGIPPAWEDPQFGCGGRWVLRLEKSKAKHMDDLWLSLSMALIGEHFADFGGDVVAGAIVSVRNRTTRIALWLTQATDEKKVMALGYGFRDVLAQTTGVTDLESKEVVFEDFRTQAVTLQLPRPGVTGLTEGIFQ